MTRGYYLWSKPYGTTHVVRDWPQCVHGPGLAALRVLHCAWQLLHTMLQLIYVVSLLQHKMAAKGCLYIKDKDSNHQGKPCL